MRPIASHFVDTSPREEEPSGVHAKPVARPGALLEHLTGAPAPVAKVLAAVARKFGVTFDELRSRDRHRRITNARHVAAWLLREQGLSLNEIGEALGGRDHSTILSAVRKIQREAERDERVAAVLREMTGELATGASNGPTSSSGSKEGRGQL